METAAIQVEAPESKSRVGRGIAPKDLIAQVRNTIPFIFANSDETLLKAPHLEPIFGRHDFNDPLQYFNLCLAAHHATVSSFVPTDVDNLIRKKLWSASAVGGAEAERNAVLSRMWELVVASYTWNFRSLSARYVTLPGGEVTLSGHNGEWLSTAVAAYGGLKRRLPELAADMAARIEAELVQEALIFREFVKNGDGLKALMSATLIAHNLGDFHRVVEMWGLQSDSALQFRALASPALNVACALNKQMMAVENHRHFVLRRPRALRRSAVLFLPLAPFLDDWGGKLCISGVLDSAELGEVVEALIDGFQALPGTVGYARALAGIESAFAGGASALHRHLPAKVTRTLKAGALRSQISIPRERFEQQWARAVLQFCRNSGI
ncbi:MAG: hypothetical protein HY074_00770 [Deltaproteobacteria bacterium]|nr:hypothetical protein [Deltaproteobacteria bacterium]